MDSCPQCCDGRALELLLQGVCACSMASKAVDLMIARVPTFRTCILLLMTAWATLIEYEQVCSSEFE